MTFILTNEQEGGSYRLVNVDQVIKAEFQDMKKAGQGRCVLHMLDKSTVKLEGREMGLALEALRASGIQGYDHSAHRPR